MKQNVRSTPPQGGFFERIAAWEHAPRALELFGELHLRARQSVSRDLAGSLHGHLTDFLLERLVGLDPGLGDGRLWRPLYTFFQDINPHYFNERDLQALLGNWPGLEPEQAAVLADAVRGWLHLLRQGFSSAAGRPVFGPSDLERWLDMFPDDWAWEAAAVPRRMGIFTMSSRAGMSALLRFEQGLFSPAPGREALRRWQAACHETSTETSTEIRNKTAGAELDLAPWRADFLAEAFAGSFRVLGLPGPCARLPHCRECPLRDDCRWSNGGLEAGGGAAAALARARKGSHEGLELDQVLQGVFGLSEERRAELKERLAGVSLRRLANGGLEELRDLLGDREPGPERLRLVLDLGRRLMEEPLRPGVEIHTPWDVFKHFRLRLRDMKQEQMLVLLLDSRRRYLGEYMVTLGTLDTSPVHPREIFKQAIRESAAFVLLVHNHPSGDPEPSDDDIQITRQLLEAGGLIGIPVLDHVVIGNDAYASLREKGHI